MLSVFYITVTKYFLSSFMQAMAVYNQLSKNNDILSSPPPRTEKSAEYCSDEDDELKASKPF
jgi:hypothetical protein